MSAPLLSVKGLGVRYGHLEALHGVDLELRAGQITTLVGANGAGKSSTLMALSGLVQKSAGSVLFDGTDISTLPAHRIVQSGLVQVADHDLAIDEILGATEGNETDLDHGERRACVGPVNKKPRRRAAVQDNGSTLQPVTSS